MKQCHAIPLVALVCKLRYQYCPLLLALSFCCKMKRSIFLTCIDNFEGILNVTSSVSVVYIKLGFIVHSIHVVALASVAIFPSVAHELTLPS